MQAYFSQLQGNFLSCFPDFFIYLAQLYYHSMLFQNVCPYGSCQGRQPFKNEKTLSAHIRTYRADDTHVPQKVEPTEDQNHGHHEDDTVMVDVSAILIALEEVSNWRPSSRRVHRNLTIGCWIPVIGCCWGDRTSARLRGRRGHVFLYVSNVFGWSHGSNRGYWSNGRFAYSNVVHSSFIQIVSKKIIASAC